MHKGPNLLHFVLRLRRQNPQGKGHHPRGRAFWPHQQRQRSIQDKAAPDQQRLIFAPVSWVAFRYIIVAREVSSDIENVKQRPMTRNAFLPTSMD